jgi:hypothetical protein
MTEHRISTLRQLTRHPLFTGGALILFLGCANWIVGSTKLTQYRALVAATAAPATDRVTLSSGFTFSDVSESHERHNIAMAKVNYYSVVVIAGELLFFLGLALTCFGYFQVRASAALARENKTSLDSMPGAT